MYFYMAYLARVIGTEGIGSIGLAQSIANFSFIAFSYGFDAIGTREVAKLKDNNQVIVNNAFSLRLVLSLIVFLLILFALVFVNRDYNVKLVIALIGTTVISQALLLNWYFVGVEKMNVIAIRTISLSILNFVGILLLVKNENDTLIAATVISATLFLNALALVYYFIKKIAPIKLQLNKVIIKQLFLSSLPISITFVLVAINHSLGIVSTSYFRPNTYLYDNGIYFAAFKFTSLALVPLSIFQNSFFAKLSQAENKEEKQSIFNKYSDLVYFFAVALAMGLFFFSDKLILILWGSKFQESVSILQIMSLSTFFAYLNVSITPALIAWGKERKVLYAISFGSAVNLIVIWLIVPSNGAYGAAVCLIIAEFLIFIAQLYFIKTELSSFNFNSLGKIFIVNLIAITPIIVMNYLKINNLFSLPLYLLILITLSDKLKIFSLREVVGMIRK